MPYTFYKIVHLTSLFIVFMSIGATILHVWNGGTRDNQRHRKWVAAWHGIGLLFVLISGFGLIAKLKLGFPTWIWGKLAIWVILGGIAAAAYRHGRKGRLLWIICAVLGLIAAFLASSKPL